MTPWSQRGSTSYTGCMYGLRRLCALGTLALMLSMTFIGGGAGCEMAGDMAAMGAAGAMAEGSMDGMDMSEMPADISAPQQESGEDMPPCPLPWAPGNCHGVAACAPTAVATGAVTLQLQSGPATRVAAFDALEPPSPTFVPESPPPRA